MSMAEADLRYQLRIKWKKISNYLRKARRSLPCTDDFLTERAKKIVPRRSQTTLHSFSTVHLTTDGVWSFQSFLEKNELHLAWEELVWAEERFEKNRCGNIMTKGWSSGSKARATFWRCMTLAAKEMMNVE